MMAPSRARRALTLVELIVVTAIFGTLLALSLPALSRVRASGRSTLCLSNLRQMSIAAQQYATVFDAWPAAIRYERRDGIVSQVAWDWETTFAGALIRPGPLWAFSDGPDRVMQCPEYLGTTNFGGDPFTGYDYNTSYLGAEAPFMSFGWRHIRPGTPPHACGRASLCAMFGDGGSVGGTNKFMRAPLGHEPGPLSLIYSGGQAFRHPGGTNVAYVDGHVGTAGQPCAGARATETLLERYMGFPENGFLSDDDSAYDPR